jgi:hypothetical protein
MFEMIPPDFYFLNPVYRMPGSSFTYRDDKTLGRTSEQRNFLTLEKYLTTTLHHNGEYAVIDYANPTKTVYVELKTRRIRHNQYPTALIGMNKIKFCDDPTKQYWFVYSYLDGLFAIKYNKELFDTFEVSNYTRGDRADAIAVENEVMFIPYEHLTQIEE